MREGRHVRVWSLTFSPFVVFTIPLSRLASLCSLLTLDLRSCASRLSFSAYCSKVTNLSLHKSLSVIKKLSLLDSLPILVSKSSRASTKAVARLRIDSWMSCSAAESWGGRLYVPKDEIRLNRDGFLNLSWRTWSNA